MATPCLSGASWHLTGGLLGRRAAASSYADGVADQTIRRVGTSGLAVSTAGLGCNNLSRKGTATETLDGSTAVVHAALEAGITLFDVADIYGAPAGRSEEFLGQALGSERDKVVIATKFGMDARGANGPDYGARGSRRYIRAAVEHSLRRLRTDWIDLYQLHRPDQDTPIDETLAALDELVQAGKVRYLGHSNFAGWQLADAAWTAQANGRTPFISAQNEYSMLQRDVEAELIPAAEAFGVGVLPFFPLANGLLTGKYTRDHAPADARLTKLKPALLEVRRGRCWTACSGSPTPGTSPCCRWRSAGCWLSRRWPV